MQAKREVDEERKKCQQSLKYAAKVLASPYITRLQDSNISISKVLRGPFGTLMTSLQTRRGSRYLFEDLQQGEILKWVMELVLHVGTEEFANDARFTKLYH